MTLDFYQFAYNADNYGVLVHDQVSGSTAVIDAGDAQATQDALRTTGWTLNEIWITHHHGDHTAGLSELKLGGSVPAKGPKGVAGIDIELGDGDRFSFAGHDVEVVHTPGHTMDMLNFYLPAQKVVFTGDTLFALGCGRVFEGTNEMMWQSLQKLMALPPDTLIYCGHEYTEANAVFALSVDPENAALITRAEMIAIRRGRGDPTVPTRLELELETNPFLRPADPDIRAHLHMQDATDADVFAEIRTRKNNF